MNIINKYRPQTFEEVVGNSLAIKALKKIAEDFSNGTSGHIMLHGPYGTGKTTLANIFAREIGATEIDIIETQIRTIDDVRDIADIASSSPLGGKARVFILNEIQHIKNNSAAQTEMLSLVEFSGKYTVFITTTTEPNNIDKALRSRFIAIPTKRLLRSESEFLLSNLCKSENIKIDKATFNIIIDKSKGIPRDIVTYFTSAKSSSSSEEAAEVLDTIIENNKTFLDLVNAIIDKRLRAAIEAFDGLDYDAAGLRISIANYMASCTKTSIKKSSLKFKRFARILDIFCTTTYFPGGEKAQLVNDIVKACC